MSKSPICYLSCNPCMVAKFLAQHVFHGQLNLPASLLNMSIKHKDHPIDLLPCSHASVDCKNGFGHNHPTKRGRQQIFVELVMPMLASSKYCLSTANSLFTANIFRKISKKATMPRYMFDQARYLTQLSEKGLENIINTKSHEDTDLVLVKARAGGIYHCVNNWKA